MTVTNVLIAGVGGQGAIMASELLALAAVRAGCDVKQGEFHGVAQRGGTVFSHVRFGDHVYSPMARIGQVDFLVALEQLEALRYAHFVKPGGGIIVNEHVIEPIRMGDDRPYPRQVESFLQDKGYEVLSVPATETAIDLGNHRAANVVLLGVLADRLDIPIDAWLETIEARIPDALLELNRRAFEAGRHLGGVGAATLA